MKSRNDRLGGSADSVQIEIDGKMIAIAEQYEVQLGVLRQPGGFSMRIGSAQTAQALLASIVPRKSRYRLFINDVLTQSGIVYGRAVPSATSTIVELRGRDYLSVVFDAFVREDKSFHEKTYVELTRRVLDELGLLEKNGHKLVTSNEVNRLALTGRHVQLTSHTVDAPLQPKGRTTQQARESKALAALRRKTGFNGFGLKLQRTSLSVHDTPSLRKAGFDPAQQELIAKALGLTTVTTTPSGLVEERAVESMKTAAAGGTSTVVVQTLKVQLGTRWFDALQREYKLSGLFLWAAADGSFVLARPSANQTASYRLVRQRDGRRRIGNIIDHRFEDDTTERHTSAIVYGRSGKGKTGRNKLRGEYIDEELRDSEFDAPIVIHDPDVATNEQAEYLARKTIAEERRAGWKLVYTVSGHTTTPLSSADGASTNWAPDTIVAVDDRELGIEGDFYLETVTLRRSPTRTELTLMRPKDLVFAKDLYPAPVVGQTARPKLRVGSETRSSLGTEP